MELVKSKGMIVFIVIVFSFVIVNSINTKKYNDELNHIDSSYISMNHSLD